MTLARPSVTRRSRDYFRRWEGWNSEEIFTSFHNRATHYYERRDQTEQSAVRLHEPLLLQHRIS